MREMNEPLQCSIAMALCIMYNMQKNSQQLTGMSSVQVSSGRPHLLVVFHPPISVEPPLA